MNVIQFPQTNNRVVQPSPSPRASSPLPAFVLEQVSQGKVVTYNSGPHWVRVRSHLNSDNLEFLLVEAA